MRLTVFHELEKFESDLKSKKELQKRNRAKKYL